jgi:TRAP-type C4-dicarboxylate transport system permease small subunit
LEQRTQPTWWARAAVFGRKLETALLVVLLGSLIVFSSTQILLRNVFSIGVTWGDGFTRLLVLWIALVGALAASSEGRHITVGALVRWLPPALQSAAAIIADVFAALLAAAFAWFSFVFVRDSWDFQDTLFDGLPAWPFQAIMPAAFGLIALRYLLRGIGRRRAG